ncbi:MAG: AraC family transcriptional regulator [Verrucomicrobiota bacterium]
MKKDVQSSAPGRSLLGQAAPYRDWTRLQMHLVWCYDGPVQRLEQEVPAQFGCISAWLLRRGAARISIGRRTWHQEAGQWLIAPPRARHQRFSADNHLLSVTIFAAWMHRLPLFDHDEVLVIPAAEHAHLEAMAERLVRQARSLSRGAHHNLLVNEVSFHNFLRIAEACPRWLETIVELLLERGCVPRTYPGLDARVLRAIQFMEAWDLSQPLTNTRVAAAVGTSVSTLITLFREAVQTTPLAYYDRIRQEVAGHALMERGASLKEVSRALGFAHAPNFTRWFRRQQGVSPREFQRQMTRPGR